MRVLATLERRTKEAVAPALERAGISDRARPRDAEALADALARRAGDGAGSELMALHRAHHRAVHPASTSASASWTRPNGTTSDLLVAHEEALRDFARAEVAPAIAEPIVAFALRTPDLGTPLAHMR